MARLISSVGFPGASLWLPRSQLFDRRFYLEQNQDVSESKDPWAHYLAFGADERRNPNALFDTSFYLERYPDVSASGLNPLVHYLEYGALEGRQASPPPDTLPQRADPDSRKPEPVQTARQLEVSEESDALLPVDSPAKLIAFFLPQFYPIKENDEFWGKGFTEWTNVARAKPNFEGHYQPQLPADLGYYDLRVPEVLEQQAEFAATYGIYGFCFYYYWFNGRRLLERPLDQMLRSGRPDFPFCICWANENWTRTWDGAASEILIQQDYSDDACEQFIRDVIPVLRHPRYIRVGGAPMLLVYRINALPKPMTITQKWREICAAEGITSLHICAVQSFGVGDPRPYGCDAAIEFPPHTERLIMDRESVSGIHADFRGYLEHYPAIARNQLALPWPDYTWYRGVMPSFDNTPRRGVHAHIYLNSSPSEYQSWLYELVKQELRWKATQEPIVFINAWNEWAEGAYLEPDQKYGRARLLATRRALLQATKDFG